MTDRPKLTLNNSKIKIDNRAKLSKNTEKISSTKQVQGGKSDTQNSGRINHSLRNDTKHNLASNGKAIVKAQELLTPKEYSLILEYLKKTYPKCFSTNNTPLPLAVGIHKQLLLTEGLPFAKVKIRRFLKRYTGSKEYHKNLILGKPRIDLEGNIDYFLRNLQ